MSYHLGIRRASSATSHCFEVVGAKRAQINMSMSIFSYFTFLAPECSAPSGVSCRAFRILLCLRLPSASALGPNR